MGALPTRLRNHGFKTKPFARISYLALLMMKRVTKKARFFSRARLQRPKTNSTSTVLTQCALDKDLELFEAGDDTEVGEKGITLRYDIAQNFASSIN